MFKPSRLILLNLLWLGCPADQGSDVAVGEPEPGTSTSGALTITETPTTTGTADDSATSTSAATTSMSMGSSGEGAGTPGTSGSESDTTGGLSGCGDGIMDPDEECDDGFAGNADTHFCTINCTLNVCGDGKLFVDWELCDQGPGNSDEYGSLCSSQCEPGARCGDNKLQPEYETCDLGLENGGVKGNEQGILCDVSCRAQQLRGFVTATAFTGNLGGVIEADVKCQAAAAAAGLPEPKRFHAFLSTKEIDAKERFKAVATALPYVLVTGKKFADNFNSLLAAGPLGEGVSVTETGDSLYGKDVATNTAPGGLHYSPDQHCQEWTSDDMAYKGRFGINAVPQDSPGWSDWQTKQAWIGVASLLCDKKDFHLYCLEI
jgi:hypothetical protein